MKQLIIFKNLQWPAFISSKFALCQKKKHIKENGLLISPNKIIIVNKKEKKLISNYLSYQ